MAGCGWQPNVIGHVISRADETTPQGRAYVTSAPVIIQNVLKNNGLILPDFYRQHGIISTIDVVIRSFEGPAYGVLEVDSPNETIYDANDIKLLTGFANVIAEAVATQKRVETLKLFSWELLQHRVRNNLQNIQGMLDVYAETLTTDKSKKGIETIILRLVTMAQMYDHLLGAGMGSTVDFGDYLSALCTNLSGLQGEGSHNVELVCIAETTQLNLDTVTAVGLAVAELVTNSYRYAFPAGRGGTINVSLHEVPSEGQVILTIADDGVGFDNGIGTNRRGLGLVETSFWRQLMARLP